ncbi:hypothetical protein S7335_4651 [Synechococcus sp. PCC 7335]|uniref:hypothetical protein n=1 Tax=Synechococcus sp. (strain ATCC 29403 / PCC 7335) TaxID=91464 RepID=UPI00017ECEE8|nr:hypothetical protein [Synechococcus sp. PCC 7335]EDX86944.1 hypothetical protein S7335_4651 [Synechococcus sp. PCC 7335]
MTTLFQAFRTQYPQGSLIADLISIYDNQFVVRASVLIEGKPIATGLAMGQSVEAAEDGARQRALAVLGLSANGQRSNQLKPNPFETTQEKTHKRETAKNGVIESSAPTPIPTPTSHEQEGLALEVEPEAASPLAELEEDLGPPILEVAEEPLASSQETSTQTVSAAAVALENFNTSSLPVDLSDVIAQTDVELRRLGWTSAQGRDYLEKTYGKRSRQQLTDDELMSFLLYLEEQ